MANGRDAVAPLPAGGARERQLGWHAVPTLPFRYPTRATGRVLYYVIGMEMELLGLRGLGRMAEERQF